jgi:hypothetical protein
VTFDGPGKYRLEVDPDGNTRILVRRGRVVVAANGRQITAREGEIHVYGIDSPRYEMVALRSPDAFDRWVDERENRFERGYVDVRQYVNDELIGIEDLREYGRWEDIPEYGRAWTPDRVAVGWRPYTVGHWFWQDPWGWTWISQEPWGWAPSHYGRWTSYRSRWYWVPVGPRVRVRYAPAVVAFVRDRDDVGWFPLHPRDRFIPWWGRRPERRNIQNITYVNRNYITVVNQNTFISSRNVTNNILRDSVIVREANSVRVMEQPLPIPNRSSLRVRGERDDRKFQRPSATVVSRPAVVRVAPVPPPPTFQEKLPEIQKTQGEPVAPDKARTMGLANLKSSNRRNPIRPAALEAGQGDFAPHTPSASAPAAQPLTAPRGKKLAKADDPGVTNVPQRAERSERPATKPDQEVTKTPSEPSKESARLPEDKQQGNDRGPQKRGKQQDQKQLQEEQQRQTRERQQLQQEPQKEPSQARKGPQQREDQKGGDLERQKQETRLQQQPQQETPQVRKGPQREEQKGRDERQQLQEQERQSRQPPPQQEQKQVRKGPPQRDEQKGRDLERPEQERQKQETRLQRQPQKEAPQVRKEPQREAPGREQVERQQPQKQEQTKSQERKAPPETRKEAQRERKKGQDEEQQKKGATPEPEASSSVTR